MKYPALALVTFALGSCTAAAGPEMAMRTPAQEARLASLLAGKVAGPPISCISNRIANNQLTIDNNTIAFRQGDRVYVNTMSSGCPGLGGTYALMIRNPSGQLCRGEIAEVADLATGARVGGCVLGDFVPYMTPRG